MPVLYLASKSPRRREILAGMGISDIEVIHAGPAVLTAFEGDETQHDGEPPQDYVVRTACEKARQAMERIAVEGKPSLPVLAADTVVICGDEILGKPENTAQARQFMAKLSGGKKKLAMLFLMLPFWVNSLIRLYGWIIILQKKGLLNYLLMKLGIIQEPLKILYSYPAIVIGMIYVLLPFMALSVYSSAEKLDWSLVEAARDLGASRWKAFWSVTFKLTLPGLLSGVILTFIPSMGLFFIADILGGNKIVLVGSLIQEQMTRGNNWPFAAALAVVLMILTTLMIVLYRKLTNVKELEGIG